MNFSAMCKVTVVVFGIYLCYIGVECTSRWSLFRQVHFLYGETIAITASVRSIHACLLTCDNACSYVQYAANGTCVLYSEALLLTEPATLTGQKVGYRKVSMCNIILILTYIVILTMHLISRTCINYFRILK